MRRGSRVSTSLYKVSPTCKLVIYSTPSHSLTHLYHFPWIRFCASSGTTAAPNTVRWKVFRRYRHFHSLNAKVGDQVPTNFSAHFPSKRWLKSNFATAFLQTRRSKLETWLRQVTSAKTLNAAGKLWVRRFLTAKANTPPFRMTTPIVAANRTLAPTTLAAPSVATLADFHLVRMLGIGAYGRVILVQHRVTSKLYAMKVLSKAAALETKQMVCSALHFVPLAKHQAPTLINVIRSTSTQSAVS